MLAEMSDFVEINLIPVKLSVKNKIRTTSVAPCFPGKREFKTIYTRPQFLFLVKSSTFEITFSVWNATVTEGYCTKKCTGSLAKYFCRFFRNSIRCFVNIFSIYKSPLHVNFNKVRFFFSMTGRCVVCDTQVHR